MSNSSRDLTHTTLQLLFIGLLIGGSFWILRPFLLALIWATMIVVATWPLLIAANAVSAVSAVCRGCDDHRLTTDSHRAAVPRSADHRGPRRRNRRRFKIPCFAGHGATSRMGGGIACSWREDRGGMAHDCRGRSRGARCRLTAIIDDVIGWFAVRVGGFGMVIFHFALTLLIAAILYVNGEAAAEAVVASPGGSAVCAART